MSPGVGKILAAVGFSHMRATLSDNARSEADRLTWDSAAHKIDSIVRELVA